MASSSRHPVPGSDREPIAGSRSVGPVAPQERIEVSVLVRPRPGARAADEVTGDQLPRDRSYPSRDAYAAAHGAAADDIAKVVAFAHAHSLVVVEQNAARRTVVMSGTAAQMAAAFDVRLQQYEHDNGTYRGRTGPITVPAELDGIVQGVFGLDDRPQAMPHFQILNPGAGAIVSRAAPASFTPPALAKLYSFPTGVDGSGECIAIIELGGGFRPADLQTYFAGLKIPMPTVKAVSVDGGRNAPTTADGADGEVMLDIEVAAAIAPKATIVVYFTPNTSKGFLDAITTAVHDTINKPSVISISWGGPESTWTSQAMTQFDQAFRDAAALGITVCCAAGDNGSGDGVNDGKPHVDFPASSPYALGCGGTKLTASGNTISDEVVRNENATTSATGGGVSAFFALPDWQKKANVPTLAKGGTAGRGVPDVAGDADPNSGYQVRVDGKNLVIGGTSAVAPLWAGLVALCNQKLGRPVGYLNPLLYGSLAGKGLFRDISQGTNGSYQARAGWDPCTGWGSPIGTKIVQALGGATPPA